MLVLNQCLVYMFSPQEEKLDLNWQKNNKKRHFKIELANDINHQA